MLYPDRETIHIFKTEMIKAEIAYETAKRLYYDSLERYWHGKLVVFFELGDRLYLPKNFVFFIRYTSGDVEYKLKELFATEYNKDEVDITALRRTKKGTWGKRVYWLKPTDLIKYGYTKPK